MRLHGVIIRVGSMRWIFFIRTENIGTRRVDFFVEGKVMVELKAVIQLEDVHLAQAINYLEAYGLDIGLLINFGKYLSQFKK